MSRQSIEIARERTTDVDRVIGIMANSLEQERGITATKQ